MLLLPICTSQVMAGNYNVRGAAVTFTPLAQYPANTLMGMCVNGLKDEAANAAASDLHQSSHGGELQREWRSGDLHASGAIPGQYADGDVCQWSEGRGGQCCCFRSAPVKSWRGTTT